MTETISADNANLPEPAEQIAALDLGSNSFHMVVGRLAEGEVRLQDSLSEKVQLAEGLDEHRYITDAAMDRALDCLARFAQRISGIPRGRVRVVGTNALRMARNARTFMARAEAVLGHDIQVVNGREEARLIYLGVAHALADDAGRRLVVDIGGGSTEVIIGERFEALETESLHMGCVSFTRRFFPDGHIDRKRMEAAVTAARREALAIDATYRASGWSLPVGASGTVKAIAKVCENQGWSNSGITRSGMDAIEKQVIKAGHVDKIKLKGLSADRAPIFAAGLAILRGLFDQFDLEEMAVSTGALREGLLYDLLGRFQHEDVRERTVVAMMRRYGVDPEQGRRVADTAEQLRRGVAADWALDDDHADALRWAGQLHELGLAVSHSQFHKHGAYLLTYSDMPGFSREDQQALAFLVRGHRRKLPLSALAELPDEDQPPLLRLCLLLRLAVRLHHARRDGVPEGLTPRAGPRGLELAFPEGWLAEHPLTRANLEEEQTYWRAANYELELT
jgi:exopolyphosphatase/guanosine-5'-triphosphate,3'-diphosphate pyrophosphatase